MNARNTLIAASISLFAGSALAAGADGPSFPSFKPMAATQAQGVAHDAAAPTHAAQRNELFRAPDGDTNQTDNMPASAGLSRADVRAELFNSRNTQVVGATRLG